MFVCVARLTLQIPESGSLKAKRQVLRRITDRVKARFNVAVAEVDDQDLWQKAVIGLSVVGNDRRHVDEQMEKIIHFVEEMYLAPLISRETEILGMGDRLFTPERPGRASEARDEDEDEDEDAEKAEAPGVEELIAQMGRGDRSMAEAEGMVDWERRHEGKGSGQPGARGRGSSMSLDDARARARSLRNPREWEKK
jgi:uncharacterized protein YlxP (DUF503 family)